MSNKEILEKAIQKAIDGGWRVFGHKSEYESAVLTHDVISGMPTILLSVRHKGRVFGYGGIPLFNIIFNHDFAKALWPGNNNVYEAEVIYSPVEGEAGYDEYLTLSEYHLQQMVIADEPIKYLGDNI